MGALGTKKRNIIQIGSGFFLAFFLKSAEKALKRFAQTINLDMMLQNHKEDIVAWEFERLSDTSKKYILENISKDILENWNLLFEKKKKKHENLREIMVFWLL